MYLEVKKQDAKYDWFVSSLKCSKQCSRTVFSGWNEPSNVRIRYLEVLKYKERLNVLKKGTRVHFSGCKILSKVKPMYLEVKLKEVKFDWWI